MRDLAAIGLGAAAGLALGLAIRSRAEHTSGIVHTPSPPDPLPDVIYFFGQWPRPDIDLDGFGEEMRRAAEPAREPND